MNKNIVAQGQISDEMAAAVAQGAKGLIVPEQPATAPTVEEKVTVVEQDEKRDVIVTDKPATQSITLEKKVMTLDAKGLTISEIAEMMDLSEESVAEILEVDLVKSSKFADLKARVGTIVKNKKFVVSALATVVVGAIITTAVKSGKNEEIVEDDESDNSDVETDEI